jgi:hypothetical protein
MKPQGRKPCATLKGAAARSAAGEKLGGRPKGSQNKVTKALKDAILEATELAGNELDPESESGTVAYMVDLAKNHKPIFGSLLKGTLGMTVALTGPDGKDMAITINLKKPNE